MFVHVHLSMCFVFLISCVVCHTKGIVANWSFSLGRSTPTSANRCFLGFATSHPFSTKCGPTGIDFAYSPWLVATTSASAREKPTTCISHAGTWTKRSNGMAATKRMSRAYSSWKWCRTRSWKSWRSLPRSLWSEPNESLDGPLLLHIRRFSSSNRGGLVVMIT